MTASPFLSSSSYYSNIPAGMVAAVSSGDPGGSNNFWVPLKYWTTSTSNSFNSYQHIPVTGSTNPYAPGCAQDGLSSTVTNPTDINWWPAKDVFGNQLNPSAYTYESVSADLDAQGHLKQAGSSPSNWTYYHKGVLNATDNAAYNFRSNATIPATVFTIGLGGNSVNGPPDPVLLQRLANDPNGDEFNTAGPLTGAYAGQYYYPCANALEKDAYGATCTTWSTQPQGTFVYAPNTTYLAQAFLRISSQVLRLSK